jgi:hypothetical protein
MVRAGQGRAKLDKENLVDALKRIVPISSKYHPAKAHCQTTEGRREGSKAGGADKPLAHPGLCAVQGGW